MSVIQDGIYGVLVGDMLGVPVEFERREDLKLNPVTGPREMGSHEQPLGTWSDDGALTLALADSLALGLSLEDIAEKSIDWWVRKKYTSHDRVFDIGQRTRLALNELLKILESGDTESLQYLHFEASEDTNGNGSLMRILPLYYHLKDKGIEDNFETIWQVSALTHPHVRSAIACLIYLVLIDEIVKQKEWGTETVLPSAFSAMQYRVMTFLPKKNIDIAEEAVFDRILKQKLYSLPETDIESSAYVVHTLEASLWCLCTTKSYEEAVLKAVNLGFDTDTTGAVTGGLAGVLYGKDSIPDSWLEVLPKKEEIEAICDKLSH